jgi:hypothetical protein
LMGESVVLLFYYCYCYYCYYWCYYYWYS